MDKTSKINKLSQTIHPLHKAIPPVIPLPHCLVAEDIYLHEGDYISFLLTPTEHPVEKFWLADGCELPSFISVEEIGDETL